MIVKGKRVLLSKPTLAKSAIEMSPEVQESIERENMKKWTHLEVFSIGDTVTDIKVGDVVYLPKYALERSDILEVDGEVKIMVAESDIAIIW